MNYLFILLIMGMCFGKEPFKPKKGSLPFAVYFPSRYRGICMGTLVSKTAVLTAAVCVAHPRISFFDSRPINVVTGAEYRHPRQGIRVQVTKIIMPKFSNNSDERAYLVQTSCAILLLKRKVPDILANVPLRGIEIDWKGEVPLQIHEECFVPGWHFFYRGDKIYPIHKFLLQRNLRIHFMNIVKKHNWCETILLKFQKSLGNLGFIGTYDKDSLVCLRDPGRRAQPCHGMYGAPMVCNGKAVGMMTAPDAQWTNCTGYTNVFHRFNIPHLVPFFSCISKYFSPEYQINWEQMKKELFRELDEDEYDYLPPFYDKLYGNLGDSSGEL